MRLGHGARRHLTVWLFFAPALSVFLLYRVLPLGWNAVLSLERWSPLRPAEFAGLAHYEEMLFHDDVFWTSLWNTLVFMSSAPIAIAIALGLALMVNAPIRGRSAYRAIIFVSYPLMPVAVGIIWRWLYDEKLGLINYALLQLGVIKKGIAFLDSFEWAMPSVIVAAIWQIVGFFMIILLAGLQHIPPNLHEAAAIDGAGRIMRWRHITLPLLRPSIFLCLVLGIINSFTSFDLIYVMTLRDRAPDHLHLPGGLRAEPVRLCGRPDRRAVRVVAVGHLAREPAVRRRGGSRRGGGVARAVPRRRHGGVAARCIAP
ncbi:MAG: sugar ABC transporter permease [Candidatus Rokuibacteriota bacterium]|nr:MAG: sugar ABC transporter permease [Candidatus Rokubacteria bacterium]